MSPSTIYRPAESLRPGAWTIPSAEIALLFARKAEVAPSRPTRIVNIHAGSRTSTKRS